MRIGWASGKVQRSKFVTCFWLYASLLLIASCKPDTVPDVTGISVTLDVKRFEKDLFALREQDYLSQIDALQRKYPILFPFYFEEIGGWNLANDSAGTFKDSIWKYVQSPYAQALYDSTMLKYSDLTIFEKNLLQSMKYFRYYFPDAVIPEVVTLINAPPAFTAGDELLCISLDKYLGPASAFYRYETEMVPNYLLRRFKAEYMVTNCMQVLATGHFEFELSGKKLLDAMVYNGKIFFLKQKLMPGVPDSIITGFEAKDLAWCIDNEPEIWKFFIEYKMLYSAEPLEFSKYVTEGPSTSGMPAEAPGNIGSWVGWRIVSAYMKRHPETTLQQLMDEMDAQKILTESRYKPAR